ncbi:hypothetical protein SAMD00024442_46_1 [Candidatus Symbiothrix dinenymphae]|nr:hypothetical protein SAMD00024442_46_1 [Candidatus Symbiothrix dinenymphae]
MTNELNVFREKLKDVELSADSTPFNILGLMYQRIKGKEILQSEILAGLLNPEENHHLGDLVVSAFFEKIGLKFDAGKMQKISVETEKSVRGRRIDIFIGWKTGSEKHAVIIENKLNNAPDLPNQLNEYHDFICNEGYTVDKIVYIPLDETKSAKNIPDIKADVLAKTVDFPAKQIVCWLEKCIEAIGKANESVSALIQYKEFIKCLILNEFQIMKAKEILEKLSLEEVQKLENLASLIGSEEWSNARFEVISQRIKDELGEPLKDGLIINYRRSYTTYAEFYFEPYEHWLELWMADDCIKPYICAYGKQDFVEILGKKYGYADAENGYHYYEDDTCFDYPKSKDDANMDNLAGAVVPILRELAKYKSKNK